MHMHMHTHVYTQVDMLGSVGALKAGTTLFKATRAAYILMHTLTHTDMHMHTHTYTRRHHID